MKRRCGTCSYNIIIKDGQYGIYVVQKNYDKNRNTSVSVTVIGSAYWPITGYINDHRRHPSRAMVTSAHHEDSSLATRHSPRSDFADAKYVHSYLSLHKCVVGRSGIDDNNCLRRLILSAYSPTNFVQFMIQSLQSKMRNCEEQKSQRRT